MSNNNYVISALKVAHVICLDDEMNAIVACAEKSRSVTISPGSVVVSDTESITEFQKIEPDKVKAVNRIAVYLTPNPNSREGVLWQEVRGKAVAFFDYELEMQRKDGEICVATPKGVLQCA